MPRTAADVTAELHALLAAADVPGPYVLVSHSFGGLFSLLYARTYPNDVNGMVFVDAVTPQMMTTLGAQWPEYQRSSLLMPNVLPGYESERYDPTASIQQINAAAPLRAIPVTVLLGDKPEPANPPSTGYSLGFQDAVFRALREAGRQFGASAPGAHVSTVPDTTHYVHTQRPDVVIAAIRSMVDELR